MSDKCRDVEPRVSGFGTLSHPNPMSWKGNITLSIDEGGARGVIFASIFVKFLHEDLLKSSADFNDVRGTWVPLWRCLHRYLQDRRRRELRHFPRFCPRYRYISSFEEVQDAEQSISTIHDEQTCKYAKERNLTETWSKVGVPYKPVRQSFQGPRRGSRAEFLGSFKGVYKRQGIRGYLVEIRPSKWKKAIWLGTYNTADQADFARDVVAFYSGQDFKYNYPELERTLPGLPSHLRLDSVEDHEAIMDFVQRQAHEAACKAKNYGKGGGSSNQNPALNKNEEIENVDTKLEAEPAATPDTTDAKLEEENKLAEECEQGNPPRSSYDELEQTDANMKAISDPCVEQNFDQLPSNVWWSAQMEENDCLNAAKADVTEGDSMCQSLDEPDGHGSPEWLIGTESEDEGLNDGSSATHPSEAEVTADSPCLETNSKYAGRKRPGDTIHEDDLITKLAPFIKKQIEDALNSTLLPLVSVLRSREEDEQKHREKLLALEEEKLALKREKLLFKRRRVARSRPAPPRASVSARSGEKKRHGLRVKSPAP